MLEGFFSSLEEIFVLVIFVFYQKYLISFLKVQTLGSLMVLVQLFLGVCGLGGVMAVEKDISNYSAAVGCSDNTETRSRDRYNSLTSSYT